ncbi:hypothetical protein HDU76_012366 [Blyttiomyces sp. JEL0837]|nr:hypothetical protein HDU76_012366 [Blyttiomyces sp. JEL0837]
MIITIIEPCYEIDTCGRKVIRISNPNYMMTLVERVQIEVSKCISEARAEVKIDNGTSYVAFNWYARRVYPKAIELCQTGYSIFMKTFGEPFSDMVTKASTIYFDKKDYWKSFRLAMVGLLFEKGSTVIGKTKHLTRAARALEALGFVEEAWICACLVKKDVRLDRKRRMQDSALLKLINRLRDKVKDYQGLGGVSKENDQSLSLDIGRVVRVLFKTEQVSLRELLDGGGNEFADAEGIGEDGLSFRMRHHSMVLLERADEFAAENLNFEALFLYLSDPSRNVKFELDDISCTIIPMIYTFSFFEPFGCWRVHLALCECLRTVGWWEEFDKMVEAGLKVWPKNEGLNKLKAEREEMLVGEDQNI